MAKKTALSKKTQKEVVPAPVAIVPQGEIDVLYKKRAEHDALKRQLAIIEKEVEKGEAALLARLKGGAVVEAGVYIAAIDSAPGACRPKWKDEAVLLAVQAGKAPGVYEAEIKAKYPPKMVETLMITKLG